MYNRNKISCEDLNNIKKKSISKGKILKIYRNLFEYSNGNDFGTDQFPSDFKLSIISNWTVKKNYYKIEDDDTQYSYNDICHLDDDEYFRITESKNYSDTCVYQIHKDLIKKIPYFESLLSGNYRDDINSSTLNVEGENTGYIFIKYLYQNEINPYVDCIKDLLELADFLMYLSLKYACDRAIEDKWENHFYNCFN